ncbi:DNA-directed RNA polymerases II 24 kDa polypeptide (RNA polymerase II subunit 5) [Coemansia sp. RSA 2711]|nr:DNA-directed RNA polymerases II 24 kDa polypeptide (RNA polymerase II subunit 5) [Coemansia sp. RSA 2711]KAJ2358609.1 DNA-directed RNA polymerases II 24 kDa polypeptide (RNA polymerase II subunit 5) [Coemansia sp. RSA 2610]KAJ2363903.1 DNA-directed RNA polymerases II 24 kDa polypeptide (RNA polymerase II subunit 5) [Coemansia sp. RSA 2611]
MDSDAREVTRMWRAYRTIHQMCKDRHYLVASTDLSRTLDQFRAEFAPNGKVDRVRLTFVVQKKDDPTNQMFVFFPDQKSIGVAIVREYIEKMTKEGVFNAIIVYGGTFASAAEKARTAVPKIRIEKFNESDLLVNITEHELVPQHRVLTNEQKQEILQRYRLKETQLPRIDINDPIAKYYGMARGQVVQIIRPSETAGRYVTYRMCM